MPIRKLPEELQKKAEEELNEDSSKIEEYLKHIREWLRKQPHLIAKDDDQTLVTFLRGCKYSLQKTKEKIDCYYSIRNVSPFFINRDPFAPDIQAVLQSSVQAPLQKVGIGDTRVLVARYENCDPDIMPMSTLIKMMLMNVNILLNEDDNAVVSGIILVLDCKGFNLNYAKQFTPTFVQQFNTAVQTAYPVRIKKIIGINTPSVVVKIYELVKHFLSKKLQERMSLYSENDLSKLYETVPKSILPTELGGDGGPYSEMTEIWKKKVESYRNWFIEDSRYCCNEKLRVGQPNLDYSIYGTEGSFRQLNLD